MIDYNKKDILVSLHIPKCGGTSFETVLRRWFSLGLYRHAANHQRNVPPGKATLQLWLKNIVPACIHGHFDKEVDKVGVFDYYPDAKQFITIYRDPLQLQLSYYFYTRKLFKHGSLYWLGTKMENIDYLGRDVDEHLEEKSDYRWLPRHLPWKLDLSNYKNIIDQNFVHIGITEDLQSSINKMAEKLGKRPVSIPKENSTQRGETPSESSVRKFKEKHALEYAFYDYVCSLNS